MHSGSKTGKRGWIVHTVLPCVLLGYVHVRMWVGNKVRIERGESILGGGVVVAVMYMSTAATEVTRLLCTGLLPTDRTTFNVVSIIFETIYT